MSPSGRIWCYAGRDLFLVLLPGSFVLVPQLHSGFQLLGALTERLLSSCTVGFSVGQLIRLLGCMPLLCLCFCLAIQGDQSDSCEHCNLASFESHSRITAHIMQTSYARLADSQQPWNDARDVEQKLIEHIHMANSLDSCCFTPGAKSCNGTCKASADCLSCAASLLLSAA